MVGFIPGEGINGPEGVLFGVPVSGNVQVQARGLKATFSEAKRLKANFEFLTKHPVRV
jgi:hypothetical protein